MYENRTESHQKGLLNFALFFFNAFNPSLLSVYYVHYETSNCKTWFFTFFFPFCFLTFIYF